MNATLKKALLIFLIGSLIIIVGALFKVMHWQFANALLLVGLLAEIFSITILAYHILKKK